MSRSDRCPIGREIIVTYYMSLVINTWVAECVYAHVSVVVDCGFWDSKSY